MQIIVSTSLAFLLVLANVTPLLGQQADQGMRHH